jgi:hypothetical protein
VTLFGFNYDREFERAVGERWPGLMSAEQALRQDAATRAVSVDVVRLERRALYDQWSKQIRGDTTVAGETPMPSLAVIPPKTR